jgi:hypothetical protein
MSFIWKNTYILLDHFPSSSNSKNSKCITLGNNMISRNIAKSSPSLATLHTRKMTLHAPKIYILRTYPRWQTFDKCLVIFIVTPLCSYIPYVFGTIFPTTIIYRYPNFIWNVKTPKKKFLIQVDISSLRTPLMKVLNFSLNHKT